MLTNNLFNENIHIQVKNNKHAYQFVVHNVKAKSLIMGNNDYNFHIDGENTIIRVEKEECMYFLNLSIA
jgi:hypothetical protein